MTQMQTKLLLKMQNEACNLEKVLTAVRESEFQLQNLSARLSLDEKIYFLTMEVEGTASSAKLSSNLSSMNEVTSVEFSPAV